MEAHHQEMAGAQDTIYLCNFRVSVDGEWLCLKQLQDVEFNEETPSPIMPIPSFGRDPVIIERSNLVNISKLVVKELIEESLRYGRMLDSDYMPLQHFFIVLEHVLRHGLKPKKGLLGPKKELWDILQMVEKYSPEAQEMTQSIRDLPTVRTHMGRARAWLRVALMQKKLADYLKVLLDHKDEVAEYFEPDALMLSDEAIIIIGLLVGLNVIDCNLCVKEEDLDCPQGVIDFSLYLRSSSKITEEVDRQGDNMIAVLDQKNYIEELNRHLNATITNLQTKVESLTTTNALMKEDLAIAKNNMLTLYDENRMLREELGKDPGSPKGINMLDSQGNEELRQLLEEERKQKRDVDKELDLQLTLKAEMEVAMKLLEKDIHEKQDTIVSLRRQLDDIKLINLEMYKKLQDHETELRYKSELVAKLEVKAGSMSEAIKSLEDKYKECEIGRSKTEQLNRELESEATRSEEVNGLIEADLKVEREWRISLQDDVKEKRHTISNLQNEIGQLKILAQKYSSLQQEYYALKEESLEQEQTMEELGKQLSESKLQVTELKEEMSKNWMDGAWAEDKSVTECKGCNKEFSLTKRKHHCRYCGDIFCKACSDNSVSLPSSAKPVRVCDQCCQIITERNK